jgi:arabinofuranosyltransferase
VNRRLSAHWHSALVGIIGLVAAAIAWSFRDRFPFDDAWITFRYAEHLASGHGLVWNIGGIPTEGYTNFLLVLLLALSKLLGADLLISSQLINSVAVIAIAVSICHLVTFESSTPARRLGGVLLSMILYLTPLVWANAFSGLETALFAALIMLTFVTAARGGDERWSFTFALLASLTRPEGALLFPILLLVGERSLFKQRLRGGAIWFVLPFAAYTIWRLIYFGHLMPNPFLVKVSRSHDAVLLPGLQYVRIFLTGFIALVAASFLGIGGAIRDKVTIRSIAWLLGITCFCLFVSPLMGFFDRFLFSVIGPLFVLAGLSLRYYFGEAGRLKIALVSIALLLVYAVSIFKSPRGKEALTFDQRTINAKSRAVGLDLGGFEHPEQITLASADAGIIPFYSKLRHLDLVGLNNRAIALAPNYDTILGLLLKERTELVLIPLEKPSDSEARCRHTIKGAHGLIAGHYLQLVHDLTDRDFRKFLVFRSEPYDLLLLVNIRGEHAREIEASLRVKMMMVKDHFDPPPDCVE